MGGGGGGKVNFGAMQSQLNKNMKQAQMRERLLKKVQEKQAAAAASAAAASGATTAVITHNLGTTDVSVQVYEVSSGETVFCDVARFSTNVVNLGFSVAPTSNQYRVIILAVE
jgi:hypothetical protein